MAHLGVEVQLLAFHLHALILDTGTLQVVHVNACKQRQQQQNCSKGDKCERTLAGLLVKILAGFLV